LIGGGPSLFREAAGFSKPSDVAVGSKSKEAVIGVKMHQTSHVPAKKMTRRTVSQRNERSQMDFGLRDINHFLWPNRDWNPDIFSELEDVYGHRVATLRPVDRWAKAFTKGQTTLSDTQGPDGRVEKN
jgi:hypothetical protein